MCINNDFQASAYQADPGMRISQRVVNPADIAREQAAGQSGGGSTGSLPPDYEKMLAQQAAVASRPPVPPVPASPGAFALQIPNSKTGIMQLRTGPF